MPRNGKYYDLFRAPLDTGLSMERIINTIGPNDHINDLKKKEDYKKDYLSFFDNEEQFNEFYDNVFKVQKALQDERYREALQPVTDPKKLVGSEVLGFGIGTPQFGKFQMRPYNFESVLDINGMPYQSIEAEAKKNPMIVVDDKKNRTRTKGRPKGFVDKLKNNYWIDYKRDNSGNPIPGTAHYIKDNFNDHPNLQRAAIWGSDARYGNALIAGASSLISNATIDLLQSAARLTDISMETSIGNFALRNMDLPYSESRVKKGMDFFIDKLEKLKYRPPEEFLRKKFFDGLDGFVYNVGVGLGYLLPQRFVPSMITLAGGGITKQLLRTVATGIGTSQAVNGFWQAGERAGIPTQDLYSLSLMSIPAVAATEWFTSNWLVRGLGDDSQRVLNRAFDQTLKREVHNTANDVGRARFLKSVFNTLKSDEPFLKSLQGTKVGGFIVNTGTGGTREAIQETVEEGWYATLERWYDSGMLQHFMFEGPEKDAVKGKGKFGTKLDLELAERLKENFVGGMVLGGIMDSFISKPKDKHASRVINEFILDGREEDIKNQLYENFLQGKMGNKGQYLGQPITADTFKDMKPSDYITVTEGRIQGLPKGKKIENDNELNYYSMIKSVQLNKAIIDRVGIPKESPSIRQDNEFSLAGEVIDQIILINDKQTALVKLEQNNGSKEEIKKIKESLEEHKRDLDYLIKPEEGSAYSEGYNDKIKSISGAIKKAVKKTDEYFYNKTGKAITPKLKKSNEYHIEFLKNYIYEGFIGGDGSRESKYFRIYKPAKEAFLKFRDDEMAKRKEDKEKSSEIIEGLKKQVTAFGKAFDLSNKEKALLPELHRALGELSRLIDQYKYADQESIDRYETLYNEAMGQLKDERSALDVRDKEIMDFQFTEEYKKLSEEERLKIKEEWSEVLKQKEEFGTIDEIHKSVLGSLRKKKRDVKEGFVTIDEIYKERDESIKKIEKSSRNPAEDIERAKLRAEERIKNEVNIPLIEDFLINNAQNAVNTLKNLSEAKFTGMDINEVEDIVAEARSKIKDGKDLVDYYNIVLNDENLEPHISNGEFVLSDKKRNEYHQKYNQMEVDLKSIAEEAANIAGDGSIYLARVRQRENAMTKKNIQTLRSFLPEELQGELDGIADLSKITDLTPDEIWNKSRLSDEDMAKNLAYESELNKVLGFLYKNRDRFLNGGSLKRIVEGTIGEISKFRPIDFGYMKSQDYFANDYIDKMNEALASSNYLTSSPQGANDAGHVSFINFLQVAAGIDINAIEKVRQEILNDENLKYNNDNSHKRKYISNTEQRAVENLVLSFMQNGKSEILEAFKSGYESQWTKVNSDNDIVEEENSLHYYIPHSVYIRGDFGAGKTHQALVNIIDQNKRLNNNKVFKYNYISPSNELGYNFRKKIPSNVAEVNIVSSLNFFDNSMPEADFVIWDEAQLLTFEQLKEIQEIKQKRTDSNGNQFETTTPIIFLGDNAQIQNFDNPFKLTPVDRAGLKTQPLIKKYSTGLPLLEGLAHYYKSMVDTTTGEASIDKPRLFVEVKDPKTKKGAKWYGSKKAMVKDFMDSVENGNNGKDDIALVFGSQKSFELFAKGSDTKKLYNELVDKKHDGKYSNHFYTLEYDYKKKKGKDDLPSISGLRKKEVYVLIDTENIGVEIPSERQNKSTQGRIGYTAVGRGENFVGVLGQTVSVNGISFNADNPTEVSWRDNADKNKKLIDDAIPVNYEAEKKRLIEILKDKDPIFPTKRDIDQPTQVQREMVHRVNEFMKDHVVRDHDDNENTHLIDGRPIPRLHTVLIKSEHYKKPKSDNKGAISAGRNIDYLVEKMILGENISETDYRLVLSNGATFTRLSFIVGNIKEQMEKEGVIPIPKVVVTNGEVAGEIDLLGIDRNGNFIIYDIKTTGNEQTWTNYTKDGNEISNNHSLQLSSYDNLARDQFNITVRNRKIIGFTVSHDSVGFINEISDPKFFNHPSYDSRVETFLGKVDKEESKEEKVVYTSTDRNSISSFNGKQSIKVGTIYNVKGNKIQVTQIQEDQNGNLFFMLDLPISYIFKGENFTQKRRISQEHVGMFVSKFREREDDLDDHEGNKILFNKTAEMHRNGRPVLWGTTYSVNLMEGNYSYEEANNTAKRKRAISPRINKLLYDEDLFTKNLVFKRKTNMIDRSGNSNEFNNVLFVQIVPKPGKEKQILDLLKPRGKYFNSDYVDAYEEIKGFENFTSDFAESPYSFLMSMSQVTYDYPTSVNQDHGNVDRKHDSNPFFDIDYTDDEKVQKLRDQINKGFLDNDGRPDDWTVSQRELNNQYVDLRVEASKKAKGDTYIFPNKDIQLFNELRSREGLAVYEIPNPKRLDIFIGEQQEKGLAFAPKATMGTYKDGKKSLLVHYAWNRKPNTSDPFIIVHKMKMKHIKSIDSFFADDINIINDFDERTWNDKLRLTNLYQFLANNKSLFEYIPGKVDVLRNFVHQYFEYKGLEPYGNIVVDIKGKRFAEEKENALNLINWIKNNWSKPKNDKNAQIIAQLKELYQPIVTAHESVSKERFGELVTDVQDIHAPYNYMELQPFVKGEKRPVTARKKGFGLDVAAGTMGKRNMVDNNKSDQVVKYISIQQAEDVVKKILGEKFVQGKLEFKPDLKDNGVRLFGQMINGQIKLRATERGINLLAPRHEIFHLVFNYMVSDETRERLLDEGRELFNDYGSSDKAIEENLANLYAEREDLLPLQPSVHPMGLWSRFKKFLNGIFKRFIKYRPTLNELFNDIDSGRFRNKSVNPFGGGSVNKHMTDEAFDRLEEESPFETVEVETEDLNYSYLKRTLGRPETIHQVETFLLYSINEHSDFSLSYVQDKRSTEDAIGFEYNFLQENYLIVGENKIEDGRKIKDLTLSEVSNMDDHIRESYLSYHIATPRVFFSLVNRLFPEYSINEKKFLKKGQSLVRGKDEKKYQGLDKTISKFLKSQIRITPYIESEYNPETKKVVAKEWDEKRFVGVSDLMNSLIEAGKNTNKIYESEGGNKETIFIDELKKIANAISSNNIKSNNIRSFLSRFYGLYTEEGKWGFRTLSEFISGSRDVGQYDRMDELNKLLAETESAFTSYVSRNPIQVEAIGSGSGMTIKVKRFDHNTYAANKNRIVSAINKKIMDPVGSSIRQKTIEQVREEGKETQLFSIVTSQEDGRKRVSIDYVKKDVDTFITVTEDGNVFFNNDVGYEQFREMERFFFGHELYSVTLHSLFKNQASGVTSLLEKILPDIPKKIPENFWNEKVAEGFAMMFIALDSNIDSTERAAVILDERNEALKKLNKNDPKYENLKNEIEKDYNAQKLNIEKTQKNADLIERFRKKFSMKGMIDGQEQILDNEDISNVENDFRFYKPQDFYNFYNVIGLIDSYFRGDDYLKFSYRGDGSKIPNDILGSHFHDVIGNGSDHLMSKFGDRLAANRDVLLETSPFVDDRNGENIFYNPLLDPLNGMSILGFSDLESYNRGNNGTSNPNESDFATMTLNVFFDGLRQKRPMERLHFAMTNIADSGKINIVDWTFDAFKKERLLLGVKDNGNLSDTVVNERMIDNFVFNIFQKKAKQQRLSLDRWSNFLRTNKYSRGRFIKFVNKKLPFYSDVLNDYFNSELSVLKNDISQEDYNEFVRSVKRELFSNQDFKVKTDPDKLTKDGDIIYQEIILGNDVLFDNGGIYNYAYYDLYRSVMEGINPDDKSIMEFAKRNLAKDSKGNVTKKRVDDFLRSYKSKSGKGKMQRLLNDRTTFRDFIFTNRYKKLAGKLSSLDFVLPLDVKNADNVGAYYKADETKERKILKWNPVMKAFFYGYEIANSNLNDVMIGVDGIFENNTDRSKRTGPSNTPGYKISTSQPMGLGKRSFVLQIEDIQNNHPEFGNYKLSDGLGFTNLLFSIPLKISSGGQYGQLGGSLYKPIYNKTDIYTGQSNQFKQASENFTVQTYKNNKFYVKAQDIMLDYTSQRIKEEYDENFPLKEMFHNLYKYGKINPVEGRKAIPIRERDAVKAMKQLYRALVNQGHWEKVRDNLVWQIVNETTSKKGRTGVNNFFQEEPFIGTEIDNDAIRIVLNPEQDLTKMNNLASPIQQFGFFGIGKVNKEIGENINDHLAAIYKIGRKRIDQEIIKTEVNKFLTGDAEYYAQLREFLRAKAESSLALVSDVGKMSEMVSDRAISLDIGGIRQRLSYAYRNYLNKILIKVPMKGIRANQSSSDYVTMFERNGMPYMVSDVEIATNMELSYEDLKDPEIIKMLKDAGFALINGTGQLSGMKVTDSGITEVQILAPFLERATYGIGENVSYVDLFTFEKDNLLYRLDDYSVDEKSTKNHLDKIFEGLTNDEILLHFHDDVATEIRSRIDRKYRKKALDKVRRDNNLKNYTDNDVMDFDSDQVIKQEEIYRTFGEKLVKETDAVSILARYYDNIKKSLETYANRVPSNRPGSGYHARVLGFINDNGNAFYQPSETTFFADDDYDIDQKSLYLYYTDSNGTRIKNLNTVEGRYNAILDNIHLYYKNPLNKDRILVKFSLDEMREIADRAYDVKGMDEMNTFETTLNDYSINKAGDNAIGIIAKSISGYSYLLQYISKDQKKSEKNIPIKELLKSFDEVGSQSILIRSGDYLQAALDNAKELLLGRFGIPDYAVDVALAMVFSGKTNQDIYDVFNNPIIKSILNETGKGKSLVNRISDYNLNLLIDKRISETSPLSNDEVKELTRKKKEIEKLIDKEKEEKEEFESKIEGIDRGVQEAIEVIEERYAGIRDEYSIINRKLDEHDEFILLSEFRDFMDKAEFVRRLSEIVSTRKGIKIKDFDFGMFVENTQDYVGMSFEEFLGDPFGKQEPIPWDIDMHMERFVTTNRNYRFSTDEKEKARLFEQEKRVVSQGDLTEIVRSFPHFINYLEEYRRILDEEMNYFEKEGNEGLWIIHNKFFNEIGRIMQEEQLHTRWDVPSMRAAFYEGINRFVLDYYFKDKFSGFNFNLVTHDDGIVDKKSVLKHIDITTAAGRSEFLLQFPQFIDQLKTMSENEDQWNSIIDDIDPSYRDWKESIIGNKFIERLSLSGFTGTEYLQLRDSMGLTSTDIVDLSQEFNKLPDLLRMMFQLNQLMATGFSYRKGSISDIMGTEIYKGSHSGVYQDKGITSSIEKLRSELNYNPEIFDEAKDNFIDWLRHQKGMSIFYEGQRDIKKQLNKAIDKRIVPETLRYNENIAGRFYVQGLKKKSPTGLFIPEYSIYNRGSFDSVTKNVSNLRTLKSFTASELNDFKQYINDVNIPVSKFFFRGHGFNTDEGYHTENGILIEPFSTTPTSVDFVKSGKTEREFIKGLIEYLKEKSGKTTARLSHSTFGVTKIISSVQSGVSIGALAAGKLLEIKTGGTARKGFKSELKDSKDIAKEYGISEVTDEWVKRQGWDKTEYGPVNSRNILDSNGTLLLGDPRSPINKQIKKIAKRLGKPLIENPTEDAFLDWIIGKKISILNVAGGTAKENKENEKRAYDFITKNLNNLEKGTKDAITKEDYSLEPVEGTSKEKKSQETFGQLGLDDLEISEGISNDDIMDFIDSTKGKSFGDESRSTVNAFRKETQMIGAKAFQSIFRQMSKSLPGISINEHTNAEIENNMPTRKGLKGWVDDKGFHFNMDIISDDTPIHEFQHVWNRFIEILDPELWSKINRLAEEEIEANGQLWKVISDTYPYLDRDKKKKELLATIAGFHSIPQINNWLRRNNVIDETLPQKIWRWLGEIPLRVTRFLNSLFRGSYKAVDKRSQLLGAVTLGDVFSSITESVLQGENVFELDKNGIRNLFNYEYKIKPIRGGEPILRDILAGNYIDSEIYSDDVKDVLFNIDIQEDYDASRPLNRPLINEIKQFVPYLNNNSDNEVSFDQMDEQMLAKNIYNNMISQFDEKGNNHIYRLGNKQHKFHKGDPEGLMNYIKTEMIPQFQKFEETLSDNIVVAIMNAINTGDAKQSFEDAFKDVGGIESKGDQIKDKLIKYLGVDERPVMAIKYSDLASSGTSILTESYLPEFTGYDPIIVVHSMNPDKNELDISILDVTSNRLGKSGLELKENGLLSIWQNDDSYRINGGTLDNSDADIRRFLVGMTIAAMGTKVDLKIRNAGVLNIRWNKINRFMIPDVGRLIHNIRLMYLIPEIKDSITNDRLGNIFSNEAIYEKNYNQSALSRLKIYIDQEIDFASRDNKVRRVSDMEQRRELFANPESTTQDMLRALKRMEEELRVRIGPEEGDPAFTQFHNSTEYKMIAAARRELETGNVGYINDVRDLPKLFVYIQNSHNLRPDIVRHLANTARRTKFMVVDEMMKYMKDVKLPARQMIELYEKSHTGANIKALTKDLGSKYFRRLFKKAIVDGREVILPQLYLRGDPDLLKLTGGEKLSDLELDYAERIWNHIKEREIKNIIHNRSKQLQYTNAVGDFIDTESTRKHAEEEFYSRYQKGEVPVLERSVNEKLQQGKFWNAFDTIIQQFSRETIFDDAIIDSNDMNIVSQALGGQTTREQRLRKAGLRFSGENQLQIVNYDDNLGMSTNLEKIGSYFMLEGIRKQIYENELIPTYNDAHALLNQLELLKGQGSQAGSRQYLKFFFERFVHRKLQDPKNLKFDLPGIGKQVDVPTLVRGMTYFNSILTLAFRPKIGLKSEAFNDINLIATTLANNLSNWKNINKDDPRYNYLPKIEDAMKASELFFTDFWKMRALALKFQLINRDERELLDSPWLVESDKNLFQEYTMHIMNWGTDAKARMISMAAVMLNEGSYNAYDYDEKTGEVTYDETKDNRWYTAGKKRISKGEQVLREALRDRLITDGLQDPTKENLSQGHDIDAIMNYMKWFNDKFIVGSMDPTAKWMAGVNYIGAAGGQFLTYLPDKAFNFGVGGNPRKVEFGARWTAVPTEGGGFKAERQDLNIEGALQSWGSMLNCLVGLSNETFEEWQQNADPIRRANIMGTAVRAGFAAMVIAMIRGALDDPKKRRYLTWVWAEFMPLLQIKDTALQPLPLINTVVKLSQIAIGKRNLVRLLDYTGPIGDIHKFMERWGYKEVK